MLTPAALAGAIFLALSRWLSDAQFVDALYVSLGGQHAETASALNYWVDVIHQGLAAGLSAQAARGDRQAGERAEKRNRLHVGLMVAARRTARSIVENRGA